MSLPPESWEEAPGSGAARHNTTTGGAGVHRALWAASDWPVPAGKLAKRPQLFRPRSRQLCLFPSTCAGKVMHEMLEQSTQQATAPGCVSSPRRSTLAGVRQNAADKPLLLKGVEVDIAPEGTDATAPCG